MNWRPKDWAKCPCDNCKRKTEDEWGLVCDLACGQHTMWVNYEAGADAMLEALKKEGRMVDRKVYATDDASKVYGRFVKGWEVFIEEKV